MSRSLSAYLFFGVPLDLKKGPPYRDSTLDELDEVTDEEEDPEYMIDERIIEQLGIDLPVSFTQHDQYDPDESLLSMREKDWYKQYKKRYEQVDEKKDELGLSTELSGANDRIEYFLIIDESLRATDWSAESISLPDQSPKDEFYDAMEFLGFSAEPEWFLAPLWF